MYRCILVSPHKVKSLLLDILKIIYSFIPEYDFFKFFFMDKTIVHNVLSPA